MTKSERQTTAVEKDGVCGIIMPIGDCTPYRDGHWKDVKSILEDAAKMAGFQPQIVSGGSDVQIIQATIVHNIYKNEIVICDVSSKNPNVMLELGLRLALGKPVVVVKDDKTDYSFDTSPILHLNYPSDLRHSEIERFKEELKNKLLTAREAEQKGGSKSYFEVFGPLIVPHISAEERGPFDVISKQIADIQTAIAHLSASVGTSHEGRRGTKMRAFGIDIPDRLANITDQNLSLMFLQEIGEAPVSLTIFTDSAGTRQVKVEGEEEVTRRVVARLQRLIMNHKPRS